MVESSVFITNKTQAVRLPVTVRFDENVKKVSVRVLGKERIISPIKNHWDSFFFGAQSVTEDCFNERDTTIQPEREAF